jgi:multidrug resistance efflux pump
MSNHNELSDKNGLGAGVDHPRRVTCAESLPPAPAQDEDALADLLIPPDPSTTNAADTVVEIARPNAEAAEKGLPAKAQQVSAIGASPAASPVSIPRMSLGRFARRLLAVGLVGCALWWLAVPFFLPISSEAVVNTRIVQVRSPIDGVTRELRREIGDQVASGDVLMCVSSDQVDTSRLASLGTRRAELKSRIERLTREQKNSEEIYSESRERMQVYQSAQLAGLQASRQEVVARGQAAQLELDFARRRRLHFEPLARSRAVSPTEIEDVRNIELVAAKQVERERAALLKVERDIRTAEQGLVDCYFLWRKEDSAAKAQELRQGAAEARQMLTALESEIVQEDRRLALLRNATLKSPQSGIVWKRQGGVGQVIKQHEPLYEVADLNNMFVEAHLHQRYLSSVVPGCRAVIQITGGQSFTGRVRAVRALGPTNVEPAFAVHLNQHDVKQVRVLIDFVPAAPDPLLIGRHARVLIIDEQPNLFQALIAWTFTKLGG